MPQRKRDDEFAKKNASKEVTIGFSLGKELKKKKARSEEGTLVWEKLDDPGLQDHLSYVTTVQCKLSSFIRSGD